MGAAAPHLPEPPMRAPHLDGPAPPCSPPAPRGVTSRRALPRRAALRVPPLRPCGQRRARWFVSAFPDTGAHGWTWTRLLGDFGRARSLLEPRGTRPQCAPSCENSTSLGLGFPSDTRGITQCSPGREQPRLAFRGPRLRVPRVLLLCPAPGWGSLLGAILLGGHNASVRLQFEIISNLQDSCKNNANSEQRSPAPPSPRELKLCEARPCCLVHPRCLPSPGPASGIWWPPVSCALSGLLQLLGSP
ncbi:uncharacterized protein LOC119506441 isoform X1 [Choloepus didactylus]|uniref:uncharacterized protein LOC119506441 isoform X1 n=1 Tax=Choloepus didactylus TaxID=27675 RepID=UPI0018A103D0|nr:uncharacterized protein LOC119506441 isoform X1 [Choloepus didactylus]